jgi:hypothetical protein
MTGRHGWRLTAMISVVCWCGLAGAQEPGDVDGALIDDLGGKRTIKKDAVEAARGVLGEELLMQLAPAEVAPQKTELEQYREHVDLELRFIARALTLTPTERQSFHEARDELIQFVEAAIAQQQLKAEPRIGGQRQPQGVERRFVAPNALARGQLPISDEMARQAVDLAIEGHLSNQILAKLEVERERLEHKAQQANVLRLLAVIDDAMLLGADQVPKLRAYFDAKWRPEWGWNLENQPVASGVTPLQTAAARGLGRGFNLSDADLQAYFRPTQIAAWGQMDSLLPVELQARNREQIMQRVGQLQGRLLKARVAEPVSVFRVLRGANGSMVLQGEAAASLSNSSRVEPVIFEPPEELTVLLDLLVENAVVAGQLSGAQRETLLLAGKLDLRRYCTERETQLQQTQTLQHADKALGVLRIVTRVEFAAVKNPFATADSRFRKALASRLDEEQLARLAEADRKRRELRREAAVQSLVRQLDEAAKLTSAQWDALAVAIRRRQELSAAAVADDFQSESDACVSWLARADLQPTVDADQWPAVEQKLIELKRVARAAAMPGVPF